MMRKYCCHLDLVFLQLIWLLVSILVFGSNVQNAMAWITTSSTSITSITASTASTLSTSLTSFPLSTRANHGHGSISFSEISNSNMMCRTNSRIRIRCNSNSNSNSNSRSTDENETDRTKNNDNDTINDTINNTDNERPIYKSKLQRLNQAQSQKSMNMKTTSKRNIKKSTTFQNNDYNNRYDNKYDNRYDNRYDNSSRKPTQSSSSFMEGFQPSTQFSKLLNDNDKNPTKTQTQNDTTNNNNDIIDEEYEYGIDSFLRGEYDRPFADDAAAPLPNHTPSEIVTIACKALRDLDIPTTDHGAAVFMRFCAPLSRGDRWGGNISGLSVGTNVGTSVNGGGASGGSSISSNSWKGIMRGSLTPTMFARRIRASEEFAVLLDWEMLDVTQGTKAVPNEMLGYESTVAFVNAALFFGDGTTPSMCQFTLKMFSGVWLIDSAVMNKNELFMEN